MLAKNANGFTEVLRALLADGQPRRMMLGLNDCAGKQPDTSWIWDADGLRVGKGCSTRARHGRPSPAV